MAFHINQILLFLTMTFIHACSASPMAMKGGMTDLNFHKTGGKIELKMGMSMFSLRLHALTEKKSDGDAVVENSTQKHKYDMFHNKDFTLSETTNNSASTPPYLLKNMRTEVALGDDKNVTVELIGLISGGNGTITDNGQDLDDVVPGLACVRVEISGWKFCDGSNVCDNAGTMETGQFLDAKFEISANGVTGAPDTTKMTFSFGSANITVPEKVKVDTLPSEPMPEGFPKYELVNGKLHMTIRIPKFSTQGQYGHVCVTLMKTEHTSGAATFAASITSFIALFAAFWLH